MKTRVAPCVYYLSFHECSKGFECEQNGICQHCKKYMPRKGFKDVSKIKRREEKEKYYE